MTDHAPTRGDIHAELEQARATFRTLIRASTPDDLARPSNGTRWTNRQLLFHMLFGYLITRNLRIVVKIVTRMPKPSQRGFAGALDASARPFDVINYWGSRLGGRVISPTGMVRWSDRIIASLHRRLDAESDEALHRSMAFPTRWDPYFKPRMSLADVYHYATLHFEHHRRQLTLTNR
jgi:DinB superfamily